MPTLAEHHQFVAFISAYLLENGDALPEYLKAIAMLVSQPEPDREQLLHLIAIAHEKAVEVRHLIHSLEDYQRKLKQEWGDETA